MQESRRKKSNEKCCNIISKLLDYEFSCESKESTCEEMYDQIIRHKTNLRRQNYQLRRQIEQAKQAILTKALGIYFAELKDLSENNQFLRERHKVIYQTKKPVINGVDELPYQPLLTPRSRHSIVKIYNNNDNSLSRASLTLNLQKQSDILAKRKSFNNSNVQNSRPLRTYGRNSLKITEAPRRNYEQQLTERKMMNSISLRVNGQNNVSTFSQTNSINCSVKGKSRAIEVKNQNIFVNFIQVMLEEEKMKEKDISQMVNSEIIFHRCHEQVYADSIQRQIDMSSKNISRLQDMLEIYQSQIKQMKLNIESVASMTKQVGKMKTTYLTIKQKCKNLQSLRTEVGKKQQRLNELRSNPKSDFFQPPSSIQMMLRLFGVEENSINDPRKCKQELRNIVKGNMEKPSKKKMKIKELLDTIREGRKKFKELMGVYQGRIRKLERKLVSLRFQQKNSQEE